ncbi:MAG TPA: hypothetical protein PLZ42_03780 [Methanothrix sp.]|nr:hypothetical protein [Methanothrix sp.]
MVRICGIGGDFFKSRFNIGLVALLLILGALSYAFTGGSAPATQAYDSGRSGSGSMEIHFFYLPTCPHCAEQKPIFEALTREGIEGVSFRSTDVSTAAGYALLRETASGAGLDAANLSVPAIFVDGRALVGFHSREEILAAIDEQRRLAEGKEAKEKETKEKETKQSVVANEGEEAKQAEEAIEKQREEDEEKEAEGGPGDGAARGWEPGRTGYDLPLLGEIDLSKYSLPALAVILGLVDGFNPCAMWVLVYLIGVLAGVGEKRKVWLIVGSFVFASGVIYFLIMTAWINVFIFLGYIRLLTILIGLLALGGGILSIREYLTTEGSLTCRVADEEARKRTRGRIDEIIRQPLSLSIFLSIVALAFVVNSVEFLCSSAIPAVFTSILAFSGLSAIESYLLIALYTFFFMLDDMVIFSMAAFAVGSSFGMKYARCCKALGGILLAALGLVMLFAPDLLR